MEDFIEYDSFLIVEKPQKIYQGFYKDGKPYNGYFSKGNVEFPRVDFYKDGIAKFQYSLDVYQMALGGDEVYESEEEDSYQMNEDDYNEYVKNKYRPRLNIKSVYKNGKIADGYEYEEMSSAIFSKKIENREIKELHIDVFAMHYYQRTSMILKEDTIIIESPSIAAEGEKFQTNLTRKDSYWNLRYTLNEEYIGSKYFVIGEETNKLPKNSMLFIYDKNDNTYGYGTSDFKDFLPTLNLIDLTNIFFDKPEIFKSQKIDMFFRDLVEASIIETKRKEGTSPKEPEIYRGYLITGDPVNIVTGIRFYEDDKSSYYEEYANGNSVKKEKIDIINFQKVFKNYLNKIRND
ncbi:hypothetical protein [Aquimarina amphilecti]|nr:hypothetical protein [Aquimarina amphilecti]